MADRQFDVSILLGAVDNASAILGQTSGSVKQLESAVNATGLALAGMGAAITASLGLMVKEAGDDEIALKRLSIAADNNSISWRDNEIAIKDFINGMMLATGVSDGELVPALQKMLIYTDSLEEAESNLKLALDMSASGFWDLETAVRLLGMAGEGNVEMLGRYIPELKSANLESLGLKEASEKAEYALGILQQKFGGMAEGELDTFNGQMRALKTQVGELSEAIGNIFIPQLTATIGKITDIVISTREWIDEHPILSGYIARLTSDLALFSGGIGSAILIIPKLVEGLEALRVAAVNHPIGAVAVGIAAVGTALVESYGAYADWVNKSAEEALLNEKLTKQFQEQAEGLYDLGDASDYASRKTGDFNVEIQDSVQHFGKLGTSSRASASQIEISADKIKNSLMDLGDSTKEYAAETENTFKELIPKFELIYGSLKTIITNNFQYEKQLAENEKNIKLRNLEQVYLAEKDAALTTYEDEAKLNKALAELDNEYAKNKLRIADEEEAALRDRREAYKAAMKAEAVIEGAVAVIKAWSEMGPLLGSIYAAVVAAEVASQIGLIDAQKFAGGVRNFGGGLALVGEEGPELVSLPGGSSVYTNRETNSMLDGGLSIYITDNHFYGTGGVEELADRISEVIFQRVKNERYV